jgi:hypothetical protein
MMAAPAREAISVRRVAASAKSNAPLPPVTVVCLGADKAEYS